MPLPFVVESLDSVPETFREEYAEKDGKFYLNVEGIDDVFVPKEVNSAANNEAATYRRQLSQWKKLGKTADEIAELIAAKEKAEEEAAKKAGNFDSLLKQHQDKAAKEKAELEAELNAARASERDAVVNERLLTALANAGATADGLDFLPGRLANRIKFETVNGKRVLKIMQADGETPMAGNGADGTATIDDLVKEASGKHLSMFKSNLGSGGAKPPIQTPGGSGITKRSDFPNTSEGERIRAAWVEKNGFEAYRALAD